MALNVYDQASRYIIRQDPPNLLAWFYPSLPGTTLFHGWLDTRNSPFPGEADRTGDTVACLEDSAGPGPLWAVPFEFQTEPDPEMFGRYQQYLGSLWRDQRPPNRPRERYGVVGCLVNLTGNPDSSRDFQLGKARTLLQLEECNVANKDAAVELNAIAAGERSPWLLPFIPLMQKGDDPGIISQWVACAGTEPNQRKRGDYGGLALVFAELAGCRAEWKQALQGWNMQVSQQVLEWQAEAEARGEARGKAHGEAHGLRQALLIYLQDRFGPLPAALIKQINAIDDPDQLRSAVFQVSKISTIDQLLL